MKQEELCYLHGEILAELKADMGWIKKTLVERKEDNKWVVTFFVSVVALLASIGAIVSACPQ